MMPGVTANYSELLRGAQLRVTAPRLAVLEVVSSHPHATAEVIRSAVCERLGTVSTQAIYDIVNTLTRARILRRIEPEGSPGRYELLRGDNHHHVVCRECGTVADVACATGQGPCLDAGQSHGFEVDTAEVIFWGTCPTCQQQPAHLTTR